MVVYIIESLALHLVDAPEQVYPCLVRMLLFEGMPLNSFVGWSYGCPLRPRFHLHTLRRYILCHRRRFLRFLPLHLRHFLPLPPFPVNVLS